MLRFLTLVVFEMVKLRQIGEATLYCGNCSEILSSLEKPGIVLTDPPYGIAYKSGQTSDTLWKAGDRIIGDTDTVARDLVVEYCLANDIPALVFGSWKASLPKGVRQRLIWSKGSALGMGDLSLPWKSSAEDIYVIGRGFSGKRDEGSVLNFSPVQSMAKNGRKHPNEKPVALLRHLLKKCPPGLVLDPFMGSGSAGEAAIMENRSFIGIEICEAYFEIACQRIEKVYQKTSLTREVFGVNNFPIRQSESLLSLLPQKCDCFSQGGGS